MTLTDGQIESKKEWHDSQKHAEKIYTNSLRVHFEVQKSVSMEI